MKITIEVEDQHKFRTLMDWLWSNHFFETATVQTHKSVTQPDNDDENDEFWMKVTEETLREDWDAPENDVWDKLYAERHGGV